jgi:hypothetical protein
VPLCITAVGCLVMFFMGNTLYELVLPIVGGEL